jgi:hypothetical protein
MGNPMHPDSRKWGCGTRLYSGTALLRGSLFEGAVGEYCQRSLRLLRSILHGQPCLGLGYTKHIELRLPRNGPFEHAVWHI